MNKIDFLKLKRFLRLQKEVRPLTYLDELARSGYLDTYIDNIFKKKIETDQDFKRRVYDALYEWSPVVNEKLEDYYLEAVCESLSFFKEFTKICQTPKP